MVIPGLWSYVSDAHQVVLWAVGRPGSLHSLGWRPRYIHRRRWGRFFLDHDSMRLLVGLFALVTLVVPLCHKLLGF